MKTFDLSKNINFSDDVQKNLKILSNLYGKKFNIKTTKFSVPVILKKEKLIVDGITPYALIYDMDILEENEYPFRILFSDGEPPKLGNDAHINHIHKTDNISGSEMVSLVLEILKKLQVKYASIYDGAKVNCGDSKMDLSFLKLIEKKRSFYEKFGFRYSVKYNVLNTRKMFLTDEKFYKLLYQTIDKFRKIKVSYYKKKINDVITLISKVILNDDFGNVNLTIIRPNINYDKEYYYSPKKENKKKLNELLKNFSDLNTILKKSSEVYLFELMVRLFNEDCNQYLKITDWIIKSKYHFIQYKNKKITFDYKYIYKFLSFLRNNFVLIIKLN